MDVEIIARDSARVVLRDDYPEIAKAEKK